MGLRSTDEGNGRRRTVHRKMLQIRVEGTQAMGQVQLVDALRDLGWEVEVFFSGPHLAIIEAAPPPKRSTIARRKSGRT